MTTILLRHRSSLLIAVLPALALLLVFLQVTDSETRAHLARENGEIEVLTVIGYFACIQMMAVRGGMRFLVQRWYLPALLLLMAMRELDFDKRFTTMGVLKSRFYLSQNVPLSEKFIGLLVVSFAIWLIVILLRRHGRSFIRGLRCAELQSLAILNAIVFVLISKSIDGLTRKLADIHVAVSGHVASTAMLLEELLELGVPAMLLIAISTYSARVYRL